MELSFTATTAKDEKGNRTKKGVGRRRSGKRRKEISRRRRQEGGRLDQSQKLEMKPAMEFEEKETQREGKREKGVSVAVKEKRGDS